ncbi:MAG: glutamate--tRNA ligase [Kistimonas sp.]|nr:glutamate--tRNA ligase [Kistimonas sp.]
MTVRTRIAPSPTGDPHVGTAYVALFNRVFARSQGGQFLLRIEDTDLQRSTRASEQHILEALRWLGLDWDEGPDKEGPCGPYRQSERQALYARYAQQLLDQGHAFRCFCTPDRLAQLRKTQEANKTHPGYDGCCLHLSAEQADARCASGTPYVIRMKVPGQGSCQFNDMLRGTVSIDWSQVDMQVLVKADGMPTYHLANVVDDHLMEISHVIRGEEWLSSTPKHVLLYSYLGWEPPCFCHLPLLRNPDKSKLSKRRNPTSITYYRDMGYLPEALLNYLGRMGWSMPDGREKFSLADMTEHFDISRVSLGGPVFDQEKLSWLNGSWIRENLSPEDLMQRLYAWRYNQTYLAQFLPFAQSRIERLSDLAPLTGFMFSGLPQLTPDQFAHKKLGEAEVRKLLQYVLWQLESLSEWTRQALFDAIKQLARALGISTGDCMQPVFVAMVGTTDSWSVVDSMAILGADVTRGRLRHALDVLGGLSGKQQKKLEKEFQRLMNAGSASETAVGEQVPSPAGSGGDA